MNVIRNSYYMFAAPRNDDDVTASFVAITNGTFIAYTVAHTRKEIERRRGSIHIHRNQTESRLHKG
jgi:hypothetical protein